MDHYSRRVRRERDTLFNGSTLRPSVINPFLLLKPCTGVFTTAMGLPCAHEIKEHKAIGLGLSLIFTYNS